MNDALNEIERKIEPYAKTTEEEKGRTSGREQIGAKVRAVNQRLDEIEKGIDEARALAFDKRPDNDLEQCMNEMKEIEARIADAKYELESREKEAE